MNSHTHYFRNGDSQFGTTINCYISVRTSDLNNNTVGLPPSSKKTMSLHVRPVT